MFPNEVIYFIEVICLYFDNNSWSITSSTLGSLGTVFGEKLIGFDKKQALQSTKREPPDDHGQKRGFIRHMLDVNTKVLPESAQRALVIIMQSHLHRPFVG